MTRKDLLLGLVKQEFGIVHYRTPYSGGLYEAVEDPCKKGIDLSHTEARRVIKKYKMKKVAARSYMSVWIVPDEDQDKNWYEKWMEVFRDKYRE